MEKRLLILFLGINSLLSAQVPTAGLSAYYPFNGNTNDYVGTRHGVPVGTAQYGTDRFGMANGCYDVVDNTNYIDLPADTWIYGDYSVSAWVKVKQQMPFPRVYDFSNGYMVNNVAGEISHSGSGHGGPAMGYSASSSSESSYFSFNTLSLNTWHHLVFISNGTQMSVYVDNVLDGMVIGNHIPENIYRTQNKIGGSNAPLNDDTKAFIDDFRLYDRAINEEEVGELFNEPNITTGVHETEKAIADLACIQILLQTNCRLILLRA